MKNTLYSKLNTCQTEEEVKSEFARFFKFKINTKGRLDHYTEQILYEFKYDKNIDNVKVRSKVIAQTLYYIRKLKYKGSSKPVPPNICIVTKNKALIFETNLYKSFYTVEKKYDWDRAPSMPCPILIKDIHNKRETKDIHVYDLSNCQEETLFREKLGKCKNTQITFFDTEKKVINEDNFLDVYEYWSKLFGEYVRDEDDNRKISEYFISDIEYGKSSKFGESSVVFNLGQGNAKIKDVPFKDYDHFWDIYEKVHNINIIYSIRQKIDRISEDYKRRLTGEFYTSIEGANKAIRYIEKVAGVKWYESGNWRIWDMAAGTGNLEFPLPTSALKYCYISSLLQDDVNYCKRIYPSATVFQYDYLNDDIAFLNNPELINSGVKPKLPEKLLNDLNNPEIKWIIFINPPFATSNTVGGDTGKKSKDNVSKTLIRDEMEKEGLKESSRELFSQFLYRINKEFGGKKAYLGLFSKIKYINSTNDQNLRDKVFKYKFECGFMFSSKNFYGTKGKFPVGFLVWNLEKEKTLESQKIVLDVYNENYEKYGTKYIISENKNNFLSKWVERPKTINIMPPFKSAINIGDGNKDIRDKVSDGFLASFMCKGNDLQNQNNTALLSGPYTSAGAYSITKENFEKSMIVHTVRRLPKADWTNDRDQFYKPNTEDISEELINDCVIWSIFSDSNNTVSIKDVEYKNKRYQISNNLFPFLLRDIKYWECHLDKIKSQIFSANEDRFFANWIESKNLSQESRNVFIAAKEIYKLFYKEVHNSQWNKYRISLWDVGFWQVKMVIKELGIGEDEMIKFKHAHGLLGEKILPQLYKYEFIPSGVILLDSED